MRFTTLISTGLCLFATVSLVGCGGSAAAGPRARNARPQVEACSNSDEVRLGRICWNPAGSRWRVFADAPGGQYEFEVELLPGGRVKSTDHPSGGASIDEWFADRNYIRFFLSDRFAEYRAFATNGSILVGQAENVSGDEWRFRAVRISRPRACLESELQLGDSCATVEGMRFRDASGKVYEFASEGRLLGGETEQTDRWTQTGGRVHLSLNGQEKDLELAPNLTTLRAADNSLQWQQLERFAPAMH